MFARTVAGLPARALRQPREPIRNMPTRRCGQRRMLGHLSRKDRPAVSHRSLEAALRVHQRRVPLLEHRPGRGLPPAKRHPRHPRHRRQRAGHVPFGDLRHSVYAGPQRPGRRAAWLWRRRTGWARRSSPATSPRTASWCRATTSSRARRFWATRLAAWRPSAPRAERDAGQFCLTPEQVAEVCAIGLRIEEHFGQPMDIEWGWADGRFALLQCRPIRGLEVARDVEAGRVAEIERLKGLSGGRRRIWVAHNLGETLRAPRRSPGTSCAAS